MSRTHILTISVTESPEIDSDIAVTCLGLDDDCRAYEECLAEDCDVEELERQHYEEGDDRPVLHNVEHRVLSWCYGVGLDACFIATNHDLGALTQEFMEDNQVGPGRYLVTAEIGSEGEIEQLVPITDWRKIDPKEAVSINLLDFPMTPAPLNELDEPCPWPWEPQQLVGVPMGQYHCGYCGGYAMAGMPHFDNRGVDAAYQAELEREHAVLCVDQLGHPHDNECECWCHGPAEKDEPF